MRSARGASVINEEPMHSWSYYNWLIVWLYRRLVQKVALSVVASSLLNCLGLIYCDC